MKRKESRSRKTRSERSIHPGKALSVLLSFIVVFSLFSMDAFAASCSVSRVGSGNSTVYHFYDDSLPAGQRESSFTTNETRLLISGIPGTTGGGGYYLYAPPTAAADAAGSYSYPVRLQTHQTASNNNPGELRHVIMHSFHPAAYNLNSYKNTLKGNRPGVAGILYPSSQTALNTALITAINVLTEAQALQVSQAAVWYFSLNKKLDPAKTNATVMTVYNAMIASAKANRGNLPQLQLQLKMTSSPAIVNGAGGVRYYGPITLNANVIDPSGNINGPIGNDGANGYDRIYLSALGVTAGDNLSFLSRTSPETLLPTAADYNGTNAPYISRNGTFYVKVPKDSTDISKLIVKGVGRVEIDNPSNTDGLEVMMAEKTSANIALLTAACACGVPLYGEIEIGCPLGDLDLRKKDKNSHALLRGAEFILYKEDSAGKRLYYYKSGTNPIIWTPYEALATKLTTNQQGRINVIGVPAGEYYFYETKAPDGYTLPSSESARTVKCSTKKGETGYVDFLNESDTPPPPSPVDLALYKVDANNNQIPLSGAEFTLYACGRSHTNPGDHSESVNSPNSGWVASQYDTSDSIGRIDFTGLLRGAEYRLKETKPPEDYELPDGEWKITVALDGSVTIIALSGGENGRIRAVVKSGSKLQLLNDALPPAEFELILYKVDASDNKIYLPGAEFTLYSCSLTHQHSASTATTNSCWKVFLKSTSGTDGKLSFKGLKSGEYRLKETKAPDGYNKPDGEWKLIVDAENGTVSCDIVGTGKIFEIKHDPDGKLLLCNDATYTLPLTGGKGLKWYLLGGGGLCLIGLALIFLARYKKGKRQ